MSKYASHIKDLLLIIGWSFMQLFKPAPEKDKVKRILCLLDLSGVGDTMCATDALYTLWLSTHGKAELYIAAPKAAIHLFKTCKLAPDAHWIELDMDGENRFNFISFKENHKKISQFQWECITKIDLMSSYMRLLLLGCKSHKILSMEFPESHHNIVDRLADYFLQNLKVSTFSCDSFILDYNRAMIEDTIHYIYPNGETMAYQEYEIPNIDRAPLKNCRYCIVCPSVSTSHIDRERKWPLDRFVEITDFIIDSSSLSVVLCGVNADKVDNNYILNHCKDPSRIIDMTGKTTFSQWIELIRNAVFVFGNDSGYIHLAAYLKVPSFVIAGYWNYGNFLPYVGDYVKKKVLPTNIRMPRPSCCSCNFKKACGNYKDGCDRLVKEHGVYKCVWDISVQQAERGLKESHLLEKAN